MVKRATFLVTTFLLVGIAAFGLNLTGLTVLGGLQPEFDSCGTDNQGDITSCSIASTSSGLDDLSANYGSGSTFRIGLDNLADSSKPIYADYAEQRGLDWRNLPSGFKQSLEKDSKCTLSADIWFQRYGRIVLENGKEWRVTDDPNDANEFYSGDMMTGRVTVSSDLSFAGSDGICRFRIGDFYNGGKWGLGSSFEKQVGGWPPDIQSGDVKVDFEVDRDGDGVLTANDNCPDSPGPESQSGCPDSDGDGISDSKDVAPNRPGSNSDGSPTMKEKVIHFLGDLLGVTYYQDWLEGDALFQF